MVLSIWKMAYDLLPALKGRGFQVVKIPLPAISTAIYLLRKNVVLEEIVRSVEEIMRERLPEIVLNQAPLFG